MRSGPIGGQFHKWNKYYDAGLARSTPNIKGGERMAISTSFCNGGLRISRSPAPVVNRMARSLLPIEQRGTQLTADRS
jgi:hypothetical protein